MSIVRIATNFNIDLDFVPAPFHRRLGAWFIDTVLQVMYIYFAGEMLSRIFRSSPDNDRMMMYAFILLALLPVLTYHVLCEIFMNGQSVGKRLVGLKVISENGGKPSYSQFIIRWIIRTADLAVVTIALSVVMATLFGSNVYWGSLFSFMLLVLDVVLVNTNKHQRLGDILAHTLLIETKQSGRIEDTVFLEVEKDYVPSFPQVMKLSDRDMNALKSILDTARKKHDYNMAEMAARKVQGHLKIETSLSAFDFLEVLLKDYNYLSAN